MRVQSRDPLDELAQNLAPMIDVVFLLLIFFMVATTFVDPEQELDLEPPTTESGAEWTEAPEELVIQVTRDGRILLEGFELDESSLRARLDQVARANPATPVTLRGDEEAGYGAVVHVFDLCRLAGLTNLGLLTREA